MLIDLYNMCLCMHVQEQGVYEDEIQQLDKQLTTLITLDV